jgi:hypothetical protein
LRLLGLRLRLRRRGRRSRGRSWSLRRIDRDRGQAGVQTLQDEAGNVSLRVNRIDGGLGYDDRSATLGTHLLHDRYGGAQDLGIHIILRAVDHFFQLLGLTDRVLIGLGCLCISAPLRFGNRAGSARTGALGCLLGRGESGLVACDERASIRARPATAAVELVSSCSVSTDKMACFDWAIATCGMAVMVPTDMAASAAALKMVFIRMQFLR